MKPYPHRAKAPAPSSVATAGFILAATLWALVAVSVAAAYINGVTATNVENARQTRLMLQAELDRRSTEATLLYLIATNRMNHRGLLLETEQHFGDTAAFANAVARGQSRPGQRPLPGQRDPFGEQDPIGELSLAGEPYAGLGDTGFSIQDELGLISVNLPRDPLFTVMMKSVGVPEDDVARLVPRIVDYTDLNDRRSLDGAETRNYLDAGLPPPANWFLATPTEMNRVLGAAEMIDAGQWRRLRDMATPRMHAGVNFNTMPVPVAKAVLGVEPDVLDTFLAERAEHPIASYQRVEELTGASPPVDPVTVAVIPSRFLRITTWWRGGAPRSVVGITLTPASQLGPWRKEYRYSEPVDQQAPLEPAPTELLGGPPEEAA